MRLGRPRGPALPVAAVVAALVAIPACVALAPTDPDGQERTFCVTQDGGESVICCPSPGLGCQAVEATQ